MLNLIDDLLKEQFPQTIDGADAAKVFEDVINPATGRPFHSAPVATMDELEAAVAAARRAQPSWAERSWEERAAALESFAKTIETNVERLAHLFTLEQGRPLAGARIEIGLACRYIRLLAAVRVSSRVLIDNEVRRVVERWAPRGVVAAIAPWNAPVVLGMAKVATALIGGNTIVIKPSELTPLCTLELGRLGRSVFPPGVFNVVSGGRAVGSALVELPGFDKISFTGSTATGRSIAAKAGVLLRPVTLELGGNDAAILLPDGSIEALTTAATATGLVNCGQFCGAVKRIYAPRNLYEATCESLTKRAKKIVIGNGLSPDVEMGPIQNKTQFDKVCAIVGDARDLGGRILTGGRPMDGDGYFYPPTVVADLTDGVRLVDEEQFGPVIPIVAYDDLDQVIDNLNAGPYGLTSSIWTADLDRGEQLASRLTVGTGLVNQHGGFDASVPMSLIKQSGIGVDYADYGVKGAMNLQVININKTVRH
jgi:acyl-CoA reductase-like NAD-dependent aldehyde dehydrogenase